MSGFKKEIVFVQIFKNEQAWLTLIHLINFTTEQF